MSNFLIYTESILKLDASFSDFDKHSFNVTEQTVEVNQGGATHELFSTPFQA